MPGHYEILIAGLKEELEQCEPKIMFYNDDPHCSLEDLQVAIGDSAWILPELGYYMDENGISSNLPPFDEAIKIVKLSEFLRRTVDGYV